MTRSRLRSWNGVGRLGSRSSTRETGYQWSLHENFSPDSGADVLGSACSAASPGTDVGAATRRRVRGRRPTRTRPPAAGAASEGSRGATRSERAGIVARIFSPHVSKWSAEVLAFALEILRRSGYMLRSRPQSVVGIGSSAELLDRARTERVLARQRGESEKPIFGEKKTVGGPRKFRDFPTLGTCGANAREELLNTDAARESTLYNVHTGSAAWLRDGREGKGGRRWTDD